MEIFIETKVLLPALQLVTKAIPNRPSHPVLGNVLIQAKDNKVVLKGFDLSLGIFQVIEEGCTVLIEGSFTVPGKLLLDITSKLPEGRIRILTQSLTSAENEENTGLIEIKSTSVNYEIRGIGAEDFPEFPEVEDAVEISIPAGVLRKGLTNTLSSASTEETKQVLTGIHIKFLENAVEFASTDGHRLSVSQLLCDVKESDLKEVTIPASTLSKLDWALSSLKDDELVKLKVGSAEVAFTIESLDRSGSIQIISRTLEGMFPNYPQLIPRAFNRTAILNRKNLITIIERIGVIAATTNKLLQFNFTKEGELTISTTSQDSGSGKEILEIEYTGDDLEVGFNLKYLLAGLKVVDDEIVSINMNTNLSPVIIRGADPENKAYLYLLMPVQIRKV